MSQTQSNIIPYIDRIVELTIPAMYGIMLDSVLKTKMICNCQAIGNRKFVMIKNPALYLNPRL